MLNKHRKLQRDCLKIFQVNTARGQENHDLALVMASREAADIILVQEPWTLYQREKRITKQHPNYTNFCPQDTWEIRPRVMTYVRKDRNLQPTQLRPADTADICWIKILGTTSAVTIVNVYRPPKECKGGEVITRLKEWQVPSNSVVAGDFNTRHPLWDSRARSSRHAEELANWALQNELSLASPADESTHNRGNVLDLVFTNILGAQCNVEEHLHTTSDHETLVTILPLKVSYNSNPQERYKLLPEAIPRLVAGIKETLGPIQAVHQDPDYLANAIIQCIQINMERFLTRRKRASQGTKWWTQDCKEKAAAYRHARKLGVATAEKQALRRATRSA